MSNYKYKDQMPSYRDKMNGDRYDTFWRWAGAVGAITAMIFSAQFAVNGLSFDFPESEKWKSWAFAALMIIVEVVWNRKGSEHGVTLYAAGLACYAFGIYTNVLGIFLYRGGIVGEAVGFWPIVGAWALPVAMGLFLELLPEPLLLWALTGDSTLADPLKNMAEYKKGFKGMVGEDETPQRSHTQTFHSQNTTQPTQTYRPAPKPTPKLNLNPMKPASYTHLATPTRSNTSIGHQVLKSRQEEFNTSPIIPIDLDAEMENILGAYKQ